MQGRGNAGTYVLPRQTAVNEVNIPFEPQLEQNRSSIAVFIFIMSESENNSEHDSHPDQHQTIAEMHNEELEPLLAAGPGLPSNNTRMSLSTARSNLLLEESKLGLELKLIPLISLVQASGIALSPSLGTFLRTFSHVLRHLYVFTDHLSVYARAHPYLLAAQIVGISTSIIFTAALPILGFSIAGPMAGSLAAGWQASIGLVNAGSLFAFLQSAGMGGAAAGLFVGGGVTGGLIAAGATIVAALGVREKIRDGFITWAQQVRDGVGRFWRSLFGGW